MTVYNVFTADANNAWQGTFTTLSKVLSVFVPLSVQNMPQVFTVIKTDSDSDSSIQDRWYIALGYLAEYKGS